MKSGNFLILKVLIIILINLPFKLIAQNASLPGNMFQSVDEPSIYKYYSEESLFVFWIYKEDVKKVVDIDTLQYGFYDSCGLPSSESLKDSGKYYFELDSSTFADETGSKIDINNACSELNIYMEDKEIRMTIYYSSRQQYTTYKKVNTLPKNVLALFTKARSNR